MRIFETAFIIVFLAGLIIGFIFWKKKVLKIYKSITIILVLAGLIFGILLAIYLLIFPEDYSDFDKKIYYINNNKIEQSWVTKSEDGLIHVWDYYGQRDSLKSDEAVLRAGVENMTLVAYEAKVKILRKINDSTAKVVVYQYGFANNKIKIRGYVPLFLLHDSIPDSLVKYDIVSFTQYKR